METEKEYRQSVESGRERRFDSKAGEQIFESHYIDGKKEGEEWGFSRMGARFATGLHDTTVMENLTALIMWNRHGTENPI